MSTIQNTDLLLINRGGTTQKCTAKDVADYISAGSTPGGGDIPSGTKMLFYQSSAPSGWVQETSVNDATIRVVSSGGGSTGGSQGFTNCFKSWTHNISVSVSSTGSSTPSGMSLSGSVGNHAISSGQTGTHSHAMIDQCANNNAATEQGGGANGRVYVRVGSATKDTGTAGRGENHNHSLSGSVSGGSHSHSGGSGSGSTSQDLRVKYAEMIICTKS